MLNATIARDFTCQGTDLPVGERERSEHEVVTMARLPLDTNIQFMTIMATKMPFVGRG
jgi:hypothetical protein